MSHQHSLLCLPIVMLPSPWKRREVRDFLLRMELKYKWLSLRKLCPYDSIQISHVYLTEYRVWSWLGHSWWGD